MIITKLLGFFDLLSSLIIILLNFSLIPWRLGASFALYLIIKGFIFKGDFSSFVDIFIGIYILILPIISFKLLTIISVIYLLQKGFFSFM
ncbi:MAG: hypothetical protein ABIC91_02710 [Nanoarchaeota archaeon]|nr:hypothetical protein [Nanoarchaeota archaeon]